MFSCGKTRAAKNYSQGNRGTQGKIAKKAEKMQIFQGRVEIPAENAVPGLPAGHSNELSNAPLRLTDAAMTNLQRLPEAACSESARGNGSNWQ